MLRSEVFVVEQNCVYLDQDGRDAEPDARQLWISHDDVVVATLRLLTDPDGARRIGRVATAQAARGAGLAAQLVRRAMEIAAGSDVVLDAQTQLVDWYRGFGFGDDWGGVPRGRHPARPDAAGLEGLGAPQRPTRRWDPPHTVRG